MDISPSPFDVSTVGDAHHQQALNIWVITPADGSPLELGHFRESVYICEPSLQGIRAKWPWDQISTKTDVHLEASLQQ